MKTYIKTIMKLKCKSLTIILIVIILCAISIAFFFVLFPIKKRNLVNSMADKYSLPRYVVASIVNIESSFDSNAISKVGAIGLMQLMPTTAFDCADRLNIEITIDDLYDESINMEIGCYYFTYLLKLFDNNIINSLCAYNWGLNNVRVWIDKGNCDSEGTITNIPVDETRIYLKKFKINKFVYQNIYRY